MTAPQRHTPLPTLHGERIKSPRRRRARTPNMRNLLRSLEQLLAWSDLGACRGADPGLFFIERGGSTAEAKRVCRGCSVREECLEWAVTTNERFGVWGGKSEKERRAERRRRELVVPWEGGRGDATQPSTGHAPG